MLQCAALAKAVEAMCNSIPPPITPHLLCLRLLLPCRLLLHVLPPPLFLLLLLWWLRRLLHLCILLLLLLLLGLLRLRLLYAVTSLPLRREVCALGPLLQRLWDGSCAWPLGIPAAIVPRLSPLWGRRGSRMLLLCPVPLGLARLPVLLVILACQVDQRLGRRPLPPPVLRRRPRRGGSQVQAQRRALLPPAGPGLRGGETASRFFVLPRNALGAARPTGGPPFTCSSPSGCEAVRSITSAAIATLVAGLPLQKSPAGRLCPVAACSTYRRLLVPDECRREPGRAGLGGPAAEGRQRRQRMLPCVPLIETRVACMCGSASSPCDIALAL